jgi:sRNA-binding carbon storage regulator CsrA
MLVLSRKPNEEIVFAALEIALKVVSINGGTVELHLDLHEQIPVFYGEDTETRLVHSEPEEGFDSRRKPR